MTNALGTLPCIERTCRIVSSSARHNARLCFIGRLFDGPLRKGSHFLTVQSIMEKLTIKKTKLLLKLIADLDNTVNVDTGHQCHQCENLLDDNTIKVFDELASLEKKIGKEIAGYD